MTNGQVNFVHDLVQMAKAFEELPQVQAHLAGANNIIEEQGQRIQHLELRLIDLKNELDAAHAATRKVEVERDHAERMFLETDDRLNAFRRLVQAFDTDVKSLVQAAEPEPKPEPIVTKFDDGGPYNEPIGDPGPAIGGAFEGQGEVDPTASTDSTFASPNVSTQPVETQTTASSDTEAVSVQPDPTPVSGNTSESAWPGSNEASLQRSEEGVPAAGTLYPADPTQATASSPAGNTPIPGSAPTDAAVGVADAPAGSAPAEDDVGYHNEPRIAGSWEAWDDWCARMNAKYGPGNWPVRPTLAAQ